MATKIDLESFPGSGIAAKGTMVSAVLLQSGDCVVQLSSDTFRALLPPRDAYDLGIALTKIAREANQINLEKKPK